MMINFLLFDRLMELFEEKLNTNYHTSTFELINKYKNLVLVYEIINEVLKSIPLCIGIRDSWIGWSKPNPKHFNTGKIIEYDNYRNYRLRNTSRFPRTTYYRIRR